MKIINLTQHNATPEQVAQGVVEPENKKEVQDLITFKNIPRKRDIAIRAMSLTNIALTEGATSVMIGGAPYLMGVLERTLLENGIQPLYSFSERRSIETHQPDGSVTKTNVFVHAGWVPAALDFVPQEDDPEI